MLEQIVNDDRFEDTEDAIVENCASYEDYGALLVELLEWKAGTDDFEQKILACLTDAVDEYIVDRLEQ